MISSRSRETERDLHLSNSVLSNFSFSIRPNLFDWSIEWMTERISTSQSRASNADTKVTDATGVTCTESCTLTLLLCNCSCCCCCCRSFAFTHSERFTSLKVTRYLPTGIEISKVLQVRTLNDELCAGKFQSVLQYPSHRLHQVLQLSYRLVAA